MISILVPNWNSGERLRRLAASFAALTDVDCELLICDNSSQDGSADGIEGGSRCNLLRADLNLGFGPALNLLAREAHGELLLFMNPDCTISDETIATLRRFASEHPKAGIIGLAMLGADGAVQPKYLPKKLPTPWSMLLDLTLLGRLKKETMPDAACRVGQVAGGAMAIRSDLFRELGGFDEQFRPAWFEDVDLCRRAIDQGTEIYFLPGAVICHEGGYSAGELGYAGLLTLYYTNMLRYVRKHLPAWTGVMRLAVVKGLFLRTIGALLLPGATGQPRMTAVRAYLRVARMAATGVPPSAGASKQ